MRVPAPTEEVSTIAVSCWKKAASANPGLLGKGLQGFHDGGNLAVRELRITGERQDLAGDPRGHGQMRGGRRGAARRGLQVIRHGVVDVGGDAARLESRPDLVARLA